MQAPAEVPPSKRSGLDLFVVSLLALFLELACIRWFPAHVLFLTFFTNTILLASFLGLSLGCLLADRKPSFILATPLLLAGAFAAAHGIEILRRYLQVGVFVGNGASPDMVFFGTESAGVDVAKFIVPIEVVAGFFFLAVALVFIGPGQELGRALARTSARLRAYTINILGSLAGILLFGASSRLELPPAAWFGAAALPLAYFAARSRTTTRASQVFALLAILPAVGLSDVTLDPLGGFRSSWRRRPERLHWSPYYRIDHLVPTRVVVTNLIGHQQMHDFSSLPQTLPYALPYVLQRDSGAPPFEDVLVIGAGSGNDVSRALAFGAKQVDAVEIDPVILRIGEAHHPARPYQDPRVHAILGDGRNALRASERRYDLIVYALVDSLVLHSSVSNIRLESYLFTREAFEDVRRRLKPGGVFCVYNYFRQGWLVARIERELEEVFGRNPLTLTLPNTQEITPRTGVSGITLFLAGDTEKLSAAFAKHACYSVPTGARLDPSLGNGFEPRSPATTLAPVAVSGFEPLRDATDDWPFLYLHHPMIPALTVNGIAIMGGIALLLIWLALPRREGKHRRFDGRMFFLGAGFMLLETKAVVHMALLFGGTWMVNSIVFAAVLVMILAANAFVLAVRPARMWPFYLALFATLALNVAVPLQAFLGWSRTAQIGASCLLVFAPIALAGVIFASSFACSEKPNSDLGANIAGSMLGGLAENTSMLLGFRYLLLVAIGFYALSAITGRRRAESP